MVVHSVFPLQFPCDTIKMNISFRCYLKYQFLRSHISSTSLVCRQSATFILFSLIMRQHMLKARTKGQGSSGSFLRGQLYFGPLAKYPRTRTCLSSVSSSFFLLILLVHVYGDGSSGEQGK